MQTLQTTSLRVADNQLFILDQQALPQEKRWLDASTVEALVGHIHALRVRGAPLIGLSASLLLALLAENGKSRDELAVALETLRASRPTAVNLMNNLDRTSEKSIFDHLSEHNAELADEIRKRMFVFEDIVTMDERSVQRFLRDCDPKDLGLALKGANSEVSNKIFQNMSTRMAQSIRDDLEITTNVRLRDVEEAQQRIVGIIRDLEEKNELIILKGGKDDIIA